MFSSLDMFRMSHAMARHAGLRQAVIAENIANADTPGYRTRDIASFAESYRTAGSGLRTTRPGHGGGQASGFDLQIRDATEGEDNPNGNSVSLESEMMKGVQVQQQHDRALAVYRNGLSILRASLGRR